jgi:hypothetical protein
MVILGGIGIWMGGLHAAPMSGPNGAPPKDLAVRKTVYAHYMHSFVYGYYPSDPVIDRALAAAHPSDLDHWPPSDGAYREFWPDDLAANMRGGDSAVQVDFDLGQRAGLDAFGLLFGRHHLPNSKFAAALEAVVRVASKNPVKVIPEIWDSWDPKLTDDQNRQELIEFGQNLKRIMDRYPGGILHLNNQPAIVLATLGVQESCQQLTAFFNAWGGMNKFFIIAYVPRDPYRKSQFVSNPLEKYAPAAAGCSVSAESMWAATAGYGDRMNAALPKVSAATQQILVWPINMPFYNVRGDMKPAGPQWVSESLGQARAIDEWRAAVARQATLVDLQTWNDFGETALTNTNHHGTSYIDLCRIFSAWFHTGKFPAASQDHLWLFYHHQLIDADVKGRQANDPKVRNETPLTDFVEVVSFLKSPGQLELRNGNGRYSIQAPAGFHDWLLYRVPAGERVTVMHTAAKDPQALPQSSSYPVSNADRTVQQIATVDAALPTASLSRGGKSILVCKGRAPIQRSAPFEDLAIVGSTAVSQ